MLGLRMQVIRESDIKDMEGTENAQGVPGSE